MCIYIYPAYSSVLDDGIVRIICEKVIIELLLTVIVHYHVYQSIFKIK